MDIIRLAVAVLNTVLALYYLWKDEYDKATFHSVMVLLVGSD